MKLKVYLSGEGAKQYLEEVEHNFSKNKIKIVYNKFLHPNYTQSPKLTFIPGLSCLDLFFYEGLQNARSILKK